MRVHLLTNYFSFSSYCGQERKELCRRRWSAAGDEGAVLGTEEPCCGQSSHVGDQATEWEMKDPCWSKGGGGGGRDGEKRKRESIGKECSLLHRDP